MSAGIVLVLILALVFGPQLWVRHVMRRHGVEITDLPGTGGELAEHLVRRLRLDGVKVEAGAPGEDHYDPDQRVIRLSPGHYDGRSLAAVAVAAHEVGHALQHKLGYPPLKMRQRLARIAMQSEKIAAFMLMAFPLAALLTRMPIVGLLMLGTGIFILLLPVLLHLATLPVEWDASFRRALPILAEGRYLPPEAMPAARQVLAAAALTYVAASLASLLNFYRWLIFLRR